MANNSRSEQGGRQRGPHWYRWISDTVASLIFVFNRDQQRSRLERKMARLVPPPITERFPQRLADLGFVRHVDTDDGEYITPPLCHVEAGPFPMGSDPRQDTDAQKDEFPQHTVETRSYEIGTYPVTVAEYDCAVRAGAVREPRYELLIWTFQLQTLDAPVSCVAWEDATAYAAWLADRTGQAWRLPTEAEWEKAARGADGRLYPWGNQWDEARAKVDDDDDPTPVGAYASHGDASPCGAHDLAGNVWEWTSSLYQPYPYAARDGREDPAAAGTRVLRGGCCCNDVSEARTASRNGNAPAEPDFAMGMRLVLAGPDDSR